MVDPNQLQPSSVEQQRQYQQLPQSQQYTGGQFAPVQQQPAQVVPTQQAQQPLAQAQQVPQSQLQPSQQQQAQSPQQQQLQPQQQMSQGQPQQTLQSQQPQQLQPQQLQPQQTVAGSQAASQQQLGTGYGSQAVPQQSIPPQQPIGQFAPQQAAPQSVQQPASQQSLVGQQQQPGIGQASSQQAQSQAQRPGTQQQSWSGSQSGQPIQQPGYVASGIGQPQSIAGSQPVGSYTQSAAVQTPLSTVGGFSSSLQPARVSQFQPGQQSASMATQTTEIPVTSPQQTLGSFSQGGAGQSSEFSPTTQGSSQSEWGASAGQQSMLIANQYEQSVPQEVRAAIEDMNHLNNVLGWAKTRLTQRGNSAAARACEDLQDASRMTKHFMLRESPFASTAVRELQQTIQGATQELQQYSGEPEVQEILTHVDRTNNSIEQSIPRLQSISLT